MDVGSRKSNSSPPVAFHVISTVEGIKRAEQKRRAEQQRMYKRILYGGSAGFIIALAVFIQVYYHPVTVVEVIHSAYTLKHAIAGDETSIPTYPVLFAGERKFPYPSNELQAFDSMWRLNPVSDKITRSTNFTNFRAAQDASITSMFESDLLPFDDISHLEIPGGRDAVWVAWEGVDTSDQAETILYLHGGIGRVCGSAQAYAGVMHELSLSAGCRVLGPNFALGPEETILQAVEDVLAAYRYLTDDLGVPAEDIFVVGDSSGALVAALALQAIRDRGIASPAGAWLMSPQTDLTASGRSIEANRARDAYFVAQADNYKMWCVLTAGFDVGVPLDHPSVSPLFADWHDLPPLLFTVAESEILLDDTLRAARKARKQGVTVSLDIQAHVPHAFPIYVNYAPEFDSAFGRGVGFISNNLSQNKAFFYEEE